MFMNYPQKINSKSQRINAEEKSLSLIGVFSNFVKNPQIWLVHYQNLALRRMSNGLPSVLF